MKHLIKVSPTAGVSTNFLLMLAVGFISWTSCTTSSLTSSEPGDTTNRSISSLSPAVRQDRYSREIHPIFANRCVVCHTCVNAPCQLHLESFPGLQRGATVSEMGTSLFESPPTRMKDAKSIQAWRKKGFFPVLSEARGGNAKDSLLYHFITLGMLNNQSGFDLKALDAHRKQKNSCVSSLDQFKKFASKYPGAGMPFGLPALDPISYQTLKTWLEDGAPGPSPQAVKELTEPSRPELIEQWESSLNGSPKARLTGRFIYEHAFMSHIHFDETPNDEFYEIVRSRTPFPAPVDEIVTQRPYDPPKTRKTDAPSFVYYRFKRVNQAVVRKTHVPWELNREKLLGIKRLFLEPSWSPDGDSQITDPGYISTNPFEVFQQIPAEARYTFMIQNAHLLIDSMIRGPVCDGRNATYAIRDNFWVFFLKPSADVTVLDPTIGMQDWMPLGSKVTFDITPFRMRYNKAMRKLKPDGYSIEDIWTGDGNNPNALLTVLRHETSATVHYGPLGDLPMTLWVLNFSNFERLYYNLVVDFKPWGNVAHKFSTWQLMRVHRSEAEERFISFIPPDLRQQVRSTWTTGLGAIDNYVVRRYSQDIPSQVQVDRSAPVASLTKQILRNMPSVIMDKMDSLSPFPKAVFKKPNGARSIRDWEQMLAYLSSSPGLKFLRFLPNIAFVRLEEQPYTFITNRAYQFNNLITLQDLAYEPEKDTLSALRGLHGDRPQLFFDLTLGQADAFLRDLQGVESASDWNAFKETYAVRRNNPHFWTLLDWFQEWDRRSSPLEAGIFDVSEYDIN